MKKLILLLSILTLPALATPAFSGECKEYAELLGMDDWMREMNWNWMQAGAHRINLWDSPSRGRVVGKLKPGTRAILLKKAKGHYKIKAPSGQGGAIGWLGDIQIKRTLKQDSVTFKPCN